MKIIFLTAFFLVLSLTYSQTKQITIIGNLSQQYGGDYVSFSKPIGKHTTNPDYIISKDTAVIKNNKFIKKLDISGPGLIYIYEKPFNGIISARFFAEPGDTIHIERKNGEIIFKGKNAIINKMYTDVKLASVAFMDEVYKIFKDNTNGEKIIALLNEKEKNYLKYYNSLYKKKEISKSCLEYTKTVMEHSIDGLVQNFATNEQYREEEKMLITNKEATKIADYFNLKYIPYKEENLKSLFFLGRIKKSALHLKEKSLKENKKQNRFWNQFDTIFKSEIENLGVIDYIEHNDYKETFIGYYFLDLTLNYDNEKTIKYKDLVLVYNAYTEKFPNSPYIIPISESIMKIALDKINTNIIESPKVASKVELGHLTVYDKTLESAENKPFYQTNQSLIDALAEKFPNQDVFIDFWATWCGPCIKQFSYNNDLHTFLDSKNIITLYLSVDKEEDVSKWKKNIKDYNLSGYHLLTNNAYREKFLEPLGKYIPMYLIYNSKTKKLKQIEGLPSEKESFYFKISEVLQIKQ